MAEAITRARLQSLGWGHVEVESAGTSCVGPSPASQGALAAGRRNGLDLSAHRSRPLTRDMIEAADLVLTMTPSHLLSVAELGFGDRAAVLPAFAAGAEEPAGRLAVPDPFGGPDEVYEETFRTLETLVARTLDRLEPLLNP